jgi:hypothetical protein
MSDHDNCPKCGRDFIDYASPVDKWEDDVLVTTYPYRTSWIIQYLGVRAQHMADPVEVGGCGWAWSDDPDAADLVNKYIAYNYKPV